MLFVRRRRPRPPSEAALYRALRRAIRDAPPATIRSRLAHWQAALPAGAAAVPAAVDAALHALDRRAYGPPGGPAPAGDPRRDLLDAVGGMRAAPPRPGAAPLPPLNPPPAIPGGRPTRERAAT